VQDCDWLYFISRLVAERKRGHFVRVWRHAVTVATWQRVYDDDVTAGGDTDRGWEWTCHWWRWVWQVSSSSRCPSTSCVIRYDIVRPNADVYKVALAQFNMLYMGSWVQLTGGQVGHNPTFWAGNITRSVPNLWALCVVKLHKQTA